jgi:hypothetical protein
VHATVGYDTVPGPIRAVTITAGASRARALIALYLVETNARRTYFRVVEWIVYVVGRACRVPSRLLPRTRGPFQLRDAPFRLVDSVPLVIERLPSDQEEPVEALAECWYGASDLKPGQRWAYPEVLAVALGAVDEGWRVAGLGWHAPNGLAAYARPVATSDIDSRLP